ncbi:MAG: helix-hairpin-helix domain-containing protein [Candidatus Methylacidiphilales bacterium]
MIKDDKDLIKEDMEVQAERHLQAKLRELPHQPGVYLFKDRFNRVIYVGKAKDLRRRVSQYFHPSRRMTADRKTRALIESIHDLETHTVRSEPESILLEGKLIKEYRPRYNISFRDDKRFLLVKINPNDRFPRFQTTRLKKEDGARYFGPFAQSGSLRRTLDMINRQFGLRTCRPEEPDEKDYRHCHDDVIRNCSAPCILKITRDEYLERVHQACAFLEGRARDMLAEVEAEMRRAAAALDFEKAARLRDMLEDLQRTTSRQKRFLREVPGTVSPEKDLVELRDVLGLANLPAHIECFDISNISTTHKVASMVVFRNGRPHRYHHRRYRIKTVSGQDDFASMAEVVRRRYSRLIAEQKPLPDLIVVDGGKGQLSSALRELEGLGCFGQAIIGLAKQREEIFRPRVSEPLVLPMESGAIRLLQRVRDEAHRVANGYHQLLMKQRMTESLLDDCPGISSAKKTALLKHFGSVERIRAADAASLAQVAGIGPKLASAVVAFFERIDQDRGVSVHEESVHHESDGTVTYRLKGTRKRVEHLEQVEKVEPA